ncbi:MAG: hypothetical protein ABIJ53_09090 [Verrucomicrobiota bacterium]
MKRIGAGLLALSFIVGVLIVPMVHRMHCDDHHATHEAAQCPICKFANTPVITTASHIAPIAESIIVGDVSLPQSFIPSVPLRGAALARAPPVA